jgi:hypothetical protein
MAALYVYLSGVAGGTYTQYSLCDLQKCTDMVHMVGEKREPTAEQSHGGSSTLSIFLLFDFFMIHRLSY